MKQVMNCHKDNGLLNMIRRTDPMITINYRENNSSIKVKVQYPSSNHITNGGTRR